MRAGFAAPFLTGAGPEASAAPEGGVRLWRLSGTAEGPRDWNAWRHRHGYTKTPAGYRWNTLGDHPEPMDPASGASYDAVVGMAWAHWAARPGGPEEPGSGRVGCELSPPGPASYRLSLWGAALDVRLELVKGRGDWRWDLGAAPRWTLDEAEWRRRHRHAASPGLDLLMRRCAAYWAEATAHLLLKDLDDRRPG